MAVVNKLATGVPDLDAASPGIADRRQNHGVLRRISFAAAIANGDSATSTFVMGRIPADAMISDLSKIHFDAVTGLTDADFGFDNDPDALVDGEDMSSAGVVDAMKAVDIANMHKKAWELAGLAASPGGELDLVLTLNQDAGAAGDIVGDIYYITD